MSGFVRNIRFTGNRNPPEFKPLREWDVPGVYRFQGAPEVRLVLLRGGEWIRLDSWSLTVSTPPAVHRELPVAPTGEQIEIVIHGAPK